MKISVYDGIQYLSQAGTLDELTRLYERLLAAYGFDQFAVQFIPEEQRKTDKKPFAIATFESEWVSYYKTEGFHTIDPVVLIGTHKRQPFLWSTLWEGVDMSARQKQFFNEASEYGVGAGVGLPIPIPGNDPGVVSLVSSYYKPKDIAKVMKEDHLELMLLATYYQSAVARFVDAQEHPSAPSLTNREKECLTWAAVGKTDNEIATILSISNRTVNAHMQSSYRKLNCVSREQAVLRAFIWKLISI